jgi:hypothetical protein
MAKHHGARQQKRIAKQKAKRSAKRAMLLRRESKDPTIRLQEAGKWPVVRALMGAQLWDEGVGYLLIVRQEPAGRLIYATFLVDVDCLGVKNAFWRDGTQEDLAEVIQKMDEVQRMQPITPECLAKIVQGAVEYAQSFGFRPHPDYHHAARLLEGIDPAKCRTQFTFGRDGKPLYVRGPNESFAQAQAIAQRVQASGGHFFMEVPRARAEELLGIEGGLDELDSLEDDSSSDE